MARDLTREKLEKLYPVGSTVKVGIRSFIIKGYSSGRFGDYRSDGMVTLSRPIIDGKMMKAGHAVADEKNIIVRGWAEKIND